MKRLANMYGWKSSFVFAVMGFPEFLANDDNGSSISELLSGGWRNGSGEG